MDRHPSVAFNHAKQRAEERFDVRLTTRKHKQIIHQIISGKAKFICFDNGVSRSKWLVKLGSFWGKVVYSPKLNLIITIMPLNREDHKLLEKEK